MTSAAVITGIHCEVAAAREGLRQSHLAIDNISYSARCRQVDEVGGDCYLFLPLPGNLLGLAVGDACGKGLPAALTIASLQASLRTAALFIEDDPAAALTIVNRQAHNCRADSQYATLFYGVFDAATRTLRYVNAGHNPPLVVRRGGSVSWLRTGGLPVGLFPDCTYTAGAIQFDPDDVLIAYTDGVTEAMNAAGEEWGIERLRELAIRSCVESASDLVDAIFAAMDEFSHGRRTDDATVMVLHVA